MLVPDFVMVQIWKVDTFQTQSLELLDQQGFGRDVHKSFPFKQFKTLNGIYFIDM